MQRQSILRKSFFVGGGYVGAGSARVMQGQMYVESLTPQRVAHPFPLVLIHGNGQTSANWLTTPDGRQGWAEWFAEQGWEVLVVDQPARGRSAWQPGFDDVPKSVPVALVERLLSAPADHGIWPQAKLHDQWPGGGRAGDPVFDQFYASQVPSLGSQDSEKLMQAAGEGLLARVGPAVLLAHSQAAAFAWLIADACPGLVKGIVAVEPSGPPFRDPLARPDRQDRPWGLTIERLTYDPPPAAGESLEFVQQDDAELPDTVRCWSLRGAPRKLVNVAGVPVLVVTGEASYHATYDHCTVSYLRRAGVETDFMRLADRGIHGNGHMMMLEKNNLQIAALLGEWMTSRIG